MMNRIRNDRGAANTVSFIVIIFFIMVMLVSFVDVGLYFNVKNEMQAAAENGARNVAIYGGTAGSLRGTRNPKEAEDVVKNSISEKFNTGGTSAMAQVTNVECGPSVEPAGGEVWCVIEYDYVGLAGEFGLFNLGRDGNGVKVTGSSVSEVTHH